LSSLADEVEIAKETPLIIAFDEVDIAIHQIHTGIPSHKNVPTLIRDKTGWNRFLDNFQRGISPYVIIIMTSNKAPDYIDTFDLSYLRMGRVDETFELKTKQE
jgi:ATP-dependent 26S proteasome regulatory subunit